VLRERSANGVRPCEFSVFGLQTRSDATNYNNVNLMMCIRSADQVTVCISVDDRGTTAKQTFMLHRGLLCSHSPYFSNAFESDVKESTEEKVIHLPDITASTLRIFQCWLYGQVSRAAPERRIKRAKKHHAPDDDDAAQIIQDKSVIDNLEAEILLDCSDPPAWVDVEEFWFDEKHNFIQHLARLYAFGHIYDTPRLRQDAMTLLVALTHSNASKISQRDCLVAVTELYDAVPSTSPMCQFLVKLLTITMGFRASTKLRLEPLPPMFLVDMVMILGSLKGDRSKIKDEIHDCCGFHEHQDKGEVIKCKRLQKLDGAFYVSFLRACMSEVYAAEDSKACKKTIVEVQPAEEEEGSVVSVEADDATLVEAEELEVYA
jgi:hypothetical protein